MNKICYDKVVESVLAGNQVMVFVHSRKDTNKTAEALIEIAREKERLGIFDTQNDEKRSPERWGMAKKEMNKSRNREMKHLFDYGFSIHHAGMLRSDRNLVEKYFGEGLIKVIHPHH